MPCGACEMAVWPSRTDPLRPWQGLQVQKDEAALEVFQSLAKIELGDGGFKGGKWRRLRPRSTLWFQLE
jgi:hypothetical protein